MVNLEHIRQHIISRLKQELSPLLTYHNFLHTSDVANQALIIAREEGVTNPETLQQLELASLYHDSGFLFSNKNHEVKSCEIAREELLGFGVDPVAIENICSIIMATKIPHVTKNHLQEIICDADLDYLGRSDFFEISKQLHDEFFALQIMADENEWEEKRIAFFFMHKYFTTSSKKRRGPGKVANLQVLINEQTK